MHFFSFFSGSRCHLGSKHVTDEVFQSLPSIDGTCIDLERAKEQQEAIVKVSDNYKKSKSLKNWQKSGNVYKLATQ